MKRSVLLSFLLATTATLAGGGAAPSSVPTGPERSLAWAPGRTGEGSLQRLVQDGERWWSQSPDARNPVACATCHHDPAATRGWAASFPKFKPIPPPHARVMTLLQATAEAVERHYRVENPVPPATAIAAYLTWQGAGLPISPGISAGQPVFAPRMEALAASVRRGGRHFARRCGSCHAPHRIAPAVTAFPRVAKEGRPESLEVFLEGHRTGGYPLTWDGREAADLMAYLTSQVAGQPLAWPRLTRPSSGPRAGPAARLERKKEEEP